MLEDIYCNIYLSKDNRLKLATELKAGKTQMLLKFNKVHLTSTSSARVLCQKHLVPMIVTWQERQPSFPEATLYDKRLECTVWSALALLLQQEARSFD